MVSYVNCVAGTIEYCPWEDFESIPGAHEAVVRDQWSLEYLQQTAYEIRKGQYTVGTIERLRLLAKVRRNQERYGN
jgi:hypothetical protein